MLILINAACVDCRTELSGVTGSLVIEWPEGNNGQNAYPQIYMQCRNRAACAGRIDAEAKKEATE